MTKSADLIDQDVDLAERAAMAVNLIIEAGIGSVLFYVHGAGDSPDDQSIHFYDDPDAARECADSHGQQSNDARRKAREHGIKEEDLVEFCWNILDEHAGQGWYNNSGGYGYVWICAGTRPQVGCQLFEYPEPEADRTAIASAFGEPIDESMGDGGNR